MRAPLPSFDDAIEAFLHRYNLPGPGLPEEEAFFARVRRCTSVPPARTVHDYPNLVDSLDTAWRVATVWPRSVEIARERRENAVRQLDAIQKMRKDVVPFHWTIRAYLHSLEQEYEAQAQRLEPDEITPLEYVRRDELRVADLGRERHGTGPKLFVREVSLAMREIFGRPHDKVVGELAGLAFEIKALSRRTVRTMCKNINLHFEIPADF
jgi:hypothetical protein